MSDNESFDYQSVVAAFVKQSLPSTPAEVHGMLTGYICIAEDTNPGTVFDNTIGTAFDIGWGGLEPILLGMLEMSSQQLAAFEFKFQFFIPDADQPLPEQVQAFGQWVQGFLAGLGLAGLEMGENADSNILETLRDLEKISQLSGELEESNDNEADFFEIAEYVRMAVISIYAEFHEPPKRTAIEVSSKLH